MNMSEHCENQETSAQSSQHFHRAGWVFFLRLLLRTRVVSQIEPDARAGLKEGEPKLKLPNYNHLDSEMRQNRGSCKKLSCQSTERGNATGQRMGRAENADTALGGGDS